jgi:hypothetical protein
MFTIDHNTGGAAPANAQDGANHDGKYLILQVLIFM